MIPNGYPRWFAYFFRPWLIFVDAWWWATDWTLWIFDWNWPRNRVRLDGGKVVTKIDTKPFWLGVIAGAPMFMFVGAMLAMEGWQWLWKLLSW